MKRVFIFIVLLLITAAVGFALYLFFFAPTAIPPEGIPGGPTVPGTGPGGLQPSGPGVPTAPPTGTEGEPGIDLTIPEGISEVATGGVTIVTPISSSPTVGASVSTSGQLNFYSKADQRFYRLQPDGTLSRLSSREFFNVDSAEFDPAGEKAIIEYPDGSNILYDFTNDQQVTLPRHWEDFDFSPNGGQIVSKSIGVDPLNRFLVVSNPDGSGARPIQELGENQDKVFSTWSPNNSIVGLAATGNRIGLERQEIFFIGQNQENFKALTVEGLDFRPKWTPDGDRLLYSTASSLSDLKPSLWLVDANGNDIGRNRRHLNITTWADKCTFAGSDAVYCAIPTELPRGAGLQPAVADGTPDEIYRIDLSTGLKKRVAIPEGSRTIEQIMLSSDESELYFVEKDTGSLNKIRLQ